MAFDPNLYAIEMELSLNAETTFDSLTKLEYTVTNIEQSLAAAMTETTDLVTNQAQMLNVQLSDMVNTLGMQSELASQDHELFVAHSDLMLTNGEEVDRQQKIEEDLRELRLEEFDLLEKFIEAQDILVKGAIKEKANLDDIVKVMSEELALRKAAAAAVDGMDSPMDDLAESSGDAYEKIQDLTSQLQTYSKQLGKIRDGLVDQTQAAEEFVDVNYRVYESQMQLLLSTEMLAGEQGVLSKNAMESMQALMGLSVAEKDLKSLVVMTSRASRITGVNTQTLAKYERQLIGVGYSLEGVEKQLEVAISAQRQFGLTATEVTEILNKQASSVLVLSQIFGKNFADENLRASLMFAKMAKDIGLPVDAFDELSEKMTLHGIDAMAFYARIGNMEAMDQGQPERFNAIQEALFDLNRTMDNFVDAEGKLSQIGFIQMTAIAETKGLTLDAVLKSRSLAEELELKGPLTYAAFNKSLEDNRTLAEESAISMQTLWAQFEELSETVTSIVAPFRIFVAEGMIPVVNTAIWLVQSFVSVITTVRNVYGWFEKVLPPLRWMRVGMQVLIGTMVLLAAGGGVAVVALGALATGFYAVFGAITSVLGIFTGPFLPVIQTAITGFEMVLNSLIGVLSSGLRTLGGAVQSVMVPLLALSFSMVLVGAGAYLFGSAIAMIADRGTIAIVAMVGLGVTIGLLGLALVGLAYLAMPVIPALLAIGGAMMMIGAAATLMGAGIALSSVGIEQIARYGKEAAIAMGYLTTAFLAFSVAGYFAGPLIVTLSVSLAAAMVTIGTAAVAAAPGILVLSVSAAALAGAFYVAGLGMDLFVNGIVRLGAVDVPSFGGALLLLALEVAASAAILGLAAVQLVVAGTGLWLFSVGLKKMADVEFEGFGGKLAWFAIDLSLGALALGLVTIPLILAGAGLWTFAIGLKNMADITLPNFGGKLAIFAVDIALGAVALGVVLAPLAIAGAGLFMFAIGLKNMADITLPNFGDKLAVFAVDIALGALALGLVMIPLLVAGAGLWMFATGLKKMSGIEIMGFGGKLIEFAGEVALGAFALSFVMIPLAVAGAGLWMFATGLKKMSDIEILGFGGKLIGLSVEIAIGVAALMFVLPGMVTASVGLWAFAFGLQRISNIDIGSTGSQIAELAENLLIASLKIIPAAIGLNVGLMMLVTVSTLFGAAGLSLLVGGTLFALGASVAANSIKSLEGSGEILEKFATALTRLEDASLGGLRDVVSDLGHVTGNVDYNVDKVVVATSKLNAIEFKGNSLVDSLSSFSTHLNTVVDQLDKPADLLAAKVQKIVDSVENLIAADAKVQEIGKNLSTALSEEKTGHQVSEFRAVEKVTQVIDNIIEKSDNETEDTELLRQILGLIEKLANKESKHKPVQDNATQLSLTSESILNAGVNV